MAISSSSRGNTKCVLQHLLTFKINILYPTLFFRESQDVARVCEYLMRLPTPESSTALVLSLQHRRRTLRLPVSIRFRFLPKCWTVWSRFCVQLRERLHNCWLGCIKRGTENRVTLNY
ncbi:hypothetical protein OUZ56_015837 [Daphnia magna]|uniref:Uncharacterized protein n=1 Tax=Daphnia magna TaxID=35525 RepID=A0ABR0ANW4_9CRUS|nr:hypothetical protein OUZ56_015837 [Daphnia magna]